MKLIIADILRRWKWRYLIVWLMAVGVDLGALRTADPITFWNTLVFAPWLGGFLVLLDMTLGTVPVLTTLPVSTRRIGLSYWIVGVCLPPVALVIAEVVAQIPSVLLGLAVAPDWPHLLVTLGGGFLLAGTSFFATTLLPAIPMVNSRRIDLVWFQIHVGVLVFVWMNSMVSGLFLPQLLQWLRADMTTKVFLAVVGLGLTIAGYQRATRMVEKRARYRGAASERSETGSTILEARVHWTRSGLLSLFVSNVPLALQMAIFGIVFGFLLPFVKGNPVYLYFCGFFVSLIALLRYAVALRFLRLLPISTHRLALILFLLPLTSGVTFGLLAASASLLVSGRAGALFGGSFPIFILVLGAGCLSAGWTVRFGLKAVAIGLPPLTIAGAVLAYIAHRHEVPAWFYCGSGAVLLRLAYVVIRQSLGASGTYRVKIEEVPVM